MWRTRRTCGKRPQVRPMSGEQTHEAEQLRENPLRTGGSTGKSTLRWKTSSIWVLIISPSRNGSILGLTQDWELWSGVPRETFPISTRTSKLFHVEQCRSPTRIIPTCTLQIFTCFYLAQPTLPPLSSQPPSNNPNPAPGITIASQAKKKVEFPQ